MQRAQKSFSAHFASSAVKSDRIKRREALRNQSLRLNQESCRLILTQSSQRRINAECTEEFLRALCVLCGKRIGLNAEATKRRSQRRSQKRILAFKSGIQGFVLAQSSQRRINAESAEEFLRVLCVLCGKIWIELNAEIAKIYFTTKTQRARRQLSLCSPCLCG